MQTIARGVEGDGDVGAQARVRAHAVEMDGRDVGMGQVAEVWEGHFELARGRCLCGHFVEHEDKDCAVRRRRRVDFDLTGAGGT
jgi:hypothetical protein